MADSGRPNGICEEGVAEFDLIETMGFDPARGIVRLEMHLDRLKRSAAELGFEFDRHAVRNHLQAASFHIEDYSRIRLLLSQRGSVAMDIARFDPDGAQDWRVEVVETKLRGDDPRRNHKTSHRDHYDLPRQRSGVDEVVFVNRDGLLTEGSFTNVFVEQADGRMATPPSTLGLIPGVLRRELIDEGRAFECELRPADLANGFFLGNSLRGLIPASLVTVAEDIELD